MDSRCHRRAKISRGNVTPNHSLSLASLACCRYDPENPVFHEFFSERLLPATLRKRLPFVRTIGLTVDFNRDVFLRCARELGEAAAKTQNNDEQMPALVKKANALLNYLVKNYFSFQQESSSGADEFFAEVASYPLVAPRAPRIRKEGCYVSPRPLVALKDSVSSDDYDLVSYKHALGF